MAAALAPRPPQLRAQLDQRAVTALEHYGALSDVELTASSLADQHAGALQLSGGIEPLDPRADRA